MTPVASAADLETLTVDLVPVIAEAVAQRVFEMGATESRLPSSTPWLSAEQAAHYLRCPVSRVRKLTMTDELPHHRDGRRVLYHRDELDAFIRGGGAKTP